MLFGAICWTWLARRSWRLAAGLTALAMLGQLAWLPVPWRDVGLQGPWAAWLAASVLQAVPGWLALAVFCRVQGRSVVLAATVGWMVAEGVSSAVQPIPANHALLLADHAVWLWPAAWGGRVALTGLAAGWAASVLVRPRLAGMVLVGWLGVGLLPGATSDQTVTVVVVQPDVHVIDARVPSNRDPLRDDLRALLDTSPTAWLTVLPEGGYPGDPGELPGTRREAFVAIVGADGPVLAGASVGREAPQTNSLLLVDGGQVAGRIDKQVLVPLWERAVLGWGNDRFVAPAGSAVIPLDGRTIGGLVCYEDLFEHRLRAVAHADLLVFASNDSWLSSVGRRVHLASARLAAVSTNRAVLRPTLDGVSAVVQPDGTAVVLPDGPRWPDSRGRLLAATVPLDGSRRPGVFVSRWLALFAWLIALVVGRR